MATIIIRNSTGSGAVPSSLVQGELAINTVDGKLFYGSGSGNIVKEFTASNSLTASYLNTLNQDLTFNGNLTLNGTASISTLVVNQTQYSSGSNQLGDAANDTQTLFGSVIIPTGSLTVTGSAIINTLTVGLGGGQQTSNTAIGVNVLSQNTTGTANTAVGYLALASSNTTGTSNSAFGYLALRFSTGGSNCAFGTTALYGITGGSNNSAFGRDAGYYIADGVTAATSLGSSVFIGANTKALANGQSNQIVIGQNAIGLGSNSAVLGNDSITRTALKGDISIGTTGSISSRLHIQGSGATSATTSFLVQNSTPTTLFQIQDNGLVGINRTPTVSLDVAGTTRLSGSFNTAASGSILTVIGSGSTQPIFTVQGSQGELFSITDSLSGSLFSVNDISGLPILEVFSDNTTLIGDYQDPMLITTKKVTMTNSGSFVVYSLPTASYDTAFFDYSIKSGSNARAGQIMAIQSGASVNFTETTTTDFGNTTAVSFTVLVSGSNMVLTGSASTGSWTIKTIVRGL